MHDLLLSTRSPERSTASSLLDTLEFTFIPSINPDGYAFTWSPDGDRLWRKNRQPTGDGCYGVDMNRNWGFHWQGGSRPNPCSEAYPGKEAFESPELKALKSYLTDKENNVKGFLDVHSFGQMSELSLPSVPSSFADPVLSPKSCSPSHTSAPLRPTRRITLRRSFGRRKPSARCMARTSKSARFARSR